MARNCFTCGDEGHYAADCPNAANVTDTGEPPWCGICDERTRLIGTDHPARCQECHPKARHHLSQLRRCPQCHALVYSWDTALECASHEMPGAPDRRPDRDHIREIIGG